MTAHPAPGLCNPDHTPARHQPRRAALALGILLAAATALRLVTIWYSPFHNWPWDHDEYSRWGLLAVRHGTLALYTRLPPQHEMQVYHRGGFELVHRESSGICNYPPLAALIFGLLGHLHHALDPTQYSNTHTARLVYNTPAALGDLLAALGLYALARQWAGHPTALFATAVFLFAFPFIYDSSIWGQTDSWIMAPALWMTWCLTTRRWLPAGLIWGIALGLKTQGVLLAPIWAYAWLTQPAHRRRIALGAAAAGAVLLLAALPFTLTSGSAWLEQAFLRNIGSVQKSTSLKAFNIWYLDLLLTERNDAAAPLLGMARSTWGTLLLLVGLLACAWAVRRRYRHHPAELTAWAALSLLAAVMLPTGVHERYILYCLPFFIALAAAVRPVWWAFLALLLAATFQIRSFEWLRFGAGFWPDIEQGVRQRYVQALEAHRQNPGVPPPPPLDVWLEAERANYRAHRRRVVAQEWLLLALSLTGAVLAAATTVAAAPRRRSLLASTGPADNENGA